MWATVVIGGGVLVLLPEATKPPLIDVSPWLLDHTFPEGWLPAEADVSRSILRAPTSHFVRSLNGAGVVTGIVRSRPFVAPEYLAVPFAGYPAEAGMGLWIECVGNGRRMPISRGNAHEVWVERTVHLGSHWCSTFTQLVAQSSQPPFWIAFGTPVRSSMVSWLKESVFTLAFAHAISLILVLGPGYTVVRLLRIRSTAATLITVAGCTPALGYLAFFAAYYLPAVLQCLSAVVWIAAAVGTTVFTQALLRRGLESGATKALVLFCALSAAFVAWVYVADVGAGSYAATYRFDPAVWSTDNQLPQIVSEAVYRGRPLAGLIGSWHVSDRPPLMTGVFLIGRPLWELLLTPGDGARILYLFYQVAGMVATSLWAVPMWSLLGGVLPDSRRRMTAIVLAAMTGMMAFNSIYIWPKMLAATLALCAYLALSQADRIRSELRFPATLSGVLAGLALMAHSGVVFGMPAVILASLGGQWRRNLGVASAFGVAAVVVILPWLIWQRTADPPGNALTKFAFAGTYGMDEPEVGVVATIERAYADMTWRKWFAMRVDAAGSMIGGRIAPADVEWLYKRPGGVVGHERLDDTIYLFQSLRALDVGWVLLAAGVFWPTTFLDRSAVRRCALWALLGLSGVGLNLLVTWSVHIIHTQSYLSLLLIIAALSAIIVASPPSLRRTVVGLQSLYFVIVWIWDPLRGATIAVGPALGLAVVIVIMVGLARSFRDSDEAALAA